MKFLGADEGPQILNRNFHAPPQYITSKSLVQSPLQTRGNTVNTLIPPNFGQFLILAKNYWGKANPQWGMHSHSSSTSRDFLWGGTPKFLAYCCKSGAPPNTWQFGDDQSAKRTLKLGGRSKNKRNTLPQQNIMAIGHKHAAHKKLLIYVIANWTIANAFYFNNKRPH